MYRTKKLQNDKDNISPEFMQLKAFTISRTIDIKNHAKKILTIAAVPLSLNL